MKNLFSALFIISFLAGCNTSISNAGSNISNIYTRNWHNTCRQDSMTDEWTCYAKYQFVYDGKKPNAIGKLAVSPRLNTTGLIMDSLFPGKEVEARVDNNRHHKHTNDGIFANNEILISEMQNGKVLLLRFYEWPYENRVEVAIPLNKFNTAFESAQTSQTYHDHK